MTTRTINRCACGRRMSLHSQTCTKCHEARMAELHAQVQVVVESGRCPVCGSGLRRNLAMAGWWQCEQYGAEGHRADNSKPSCGWQGFTC